MPWTKVTDSILCEPKMSAKYADRVSTLLHIEITQYVELALHVGINCNFTIGWVLLMLVN